MGVYAVSSTVKVGSHDYKALCEDSGYRGEAEWQHFLLVVLVLERKAQELSVSTVNGYMRVGSL